AGDEAARPDIEAGGGAAQDLRRGGGAQRAGGQALGAGPAGAAQAEGGSEARGGQVAAAVGGLGQVTAVLSGGSRRLCDEPRRPVGDPTHNGGARQASTRPTGPGTFSPPANRGHLPNSPDCSSPHEGTSV